MWEFQPKTLIWPIVTIITREKTNILPHVFQGLGVVCGADTNSQDTGEEDSAKSRGISRGLNDTYFKDPDVKLQTSLTSQQLIKFFWQVADGMHYLSSKNVSYFQIERSSGTF